MHISHIEQHLGSKAHDLLSHTCHTIPRDQLYLPGPDFIERVLSYSDRSIPVLRSLQTLYNHGNLKGTGYLNILPVDQGIEHSAGSAFSTNPIYFDPENLVKLAIDGGCSAIASTLGALGIIARKYAHKIPFILKCNHNELLTYPNKSDQLLFASVKQAWEMGCVAVGATIYFGSQESSRQLVEVSKLFDQAHQLGMATILWCYLRNPSFKTPEQDFHTSADLTGQANHLGVTIQADIVKQKLPDCNGGFKALKFGKENHKMYDSLCSENPIDRVRYQVANGYLGKIGLINSGGASGENDLAAAIETAILNKRGGGMGLILGRKAFQRPMKEGIELLHAVQSIYLSKEITIA
jgi:class I fructose-bisphosphate aldolase